MSPENRYFSSHSEFSSSSSNTKDMYNNSKYNHNTYRNRFLLRAVLNFILVWMFFTFKSVNDINIANDIKHNSLFHSEEGEGKSLVKSINLKSERIFSFSATNFIFAVTQDYKCYSPYSSHTTKL